MTFDVEAVRRRFPALARRDGGRRRYYLDNPAGTQVPQSVVDAMSHCLLDANANLGGTFETSRRADAIAAGAHAAMADLLNAPSADEIVFGQNMTTLTFQFSRAIGQQLEPGDEIVLSRMDHDANVQPWRLLARDRGLVVRWFEFDTEAGEFDLARLDDVLTGKTRLVCIGAASNLLGTLNDVRGICRRAAEAGAWTYVDAVQSVPHVSTDVQDIGCDFLVCSAYKFFGPHQGILWGRLERLRKLDAYKVRPAPDAPPGRYETGTQSHEGMAGTAAAVDYLAELAGAGAPADRRSALCAAMARMADYERELSARLVRGLVSIPGVTVHGVTAADGMSRRVPTVSFTHVSADPHEVARRLGDRNFFVWSGHNYALEAARALGIDGRGGAVRIGPVHYNTLSEIDDLLNAVEDVLEEA